MSTPSVVRVVEERLMLSSQASTRAKTGGSMLSSPLRSMCVLPRASNVPLKRLRSRMFWYGVLESLGVIGMAMYVNVHSSCVLRFGDLTRAHAADSRFMSCKPSSRRQGDDTRCNLLLRLFTYHYYFLFVRLHYDYYESVLSTSMRLARLEFRRDPRQTTESSP